MKDKITQLELEKLRIEYDHCERIVWNVLWIVSIAVVFIVLAVIKGAISFLNGLFIFCVIGLIFAISLIPVAKRSDDITKVEIPRLIKGLERKK